MTGDLNMGNHNILHASNYVPSSDHHVVNKKYATNFSLPNTVANLYTLQMDDDVSSIVYTRSNKKVEISHKPTQTNNPISKSLQLTIFIVFNIWVMIPTIYIWSLHKTF